MLWQSIVLFVSAGIAVVVIRRFAIHTPYDRAERERQRKVEEAVEAKKVSELAKRLRLNYALDQQPAVVKPPLNLVPPPESKIKRNIEMEGLNSRRPSGPSVS
jgi:hypothetical protein